MDITVRDELNRRADDNLVEYVEGPNRLKSWSVTDKG